VIVGIILSILAPILQSLFNWQFPEKGIFSGCLRGIVDSLSGRLASALRKISQYSQPMVHQSTAIAHLYIADPKGSKFGKKLVVFLPLILR